VKSSSIQGTFHPIFTHFHFLLISVLLANCLCSPIAKGPILQCYIQRKIEGDGASKMFPIYELCTKDDRFLLVGVKRCDLSSCFTYAC
jgi:hypothetical protein